MEDIILVGFGGHAKSVADVIERQGMYRIVGYTDTERQNSFYQYLGTDEVLEKYFDRGVKNAAVCVGYLGTGNVRQRIYDKLKNIGYVLPVIADPSAVISSSSGIGEGTFVGKLAVINTEAKIGKMAIINTKSLVEHEAVVGDFAHVAVGAVLCGQAEIGTAAFIGANATVIQCVKIPDNALIPAGETVRNIRDRMKME